MLRNAHHKALTKIITVDGVKVEVALFCTYDIQVTTDENGDDCHLNTFGPPMTEDELTDYVRENINLGSCAHPGCNKTIALQRKQRAKYNLCKQHEADRHAKVMAKIRREEAIANRRLRVERVTQKANGFTHVAEAWVHGGGDDKGIDIYYKGKPSNNQVVQDIIEQGCCRGDDFVVLAL